MLALLSLLLAAFPSPERAEDLNLAAEMGQLRGQMALVDSHLIALEARALEQHARFDRMSQDIRALGQEVSGARAGVAGPFLSAPPASSDTAGVAKVAIFAPRVEVDASRRHDVVTLKVRRMEAQAVRSVGDVDLGIDQTSVSLPIDENGSLYIVEWATPEGNTYNLILRDGATGQSVASVVVKPLQNQGRFIFVGYRLE